MKKLSIVGLDIAKSAFQVHGLDEREQVVLRKKLSRSKVEKFFAELEPCVVVMEACATAHHWGRVFTGQGHTVRLVPPAVVKGYLQGNKNDARDASAIAEAGSRPRTRLVPVKTMEQQAILSLHRAREVLMRQRTTLINAVRGHLAEFGIVAAKGGRGLNQLKAVFELASDEQVPPELRLAIKTLLAQIDQADMGLLKIDRRIVELLASNPTGQHLITIPGVGPITASAIAAMVPDPKQFRCGRHFAAWLGLVPQQNSTGGKERLGSITKRGDRYLRKLLVLGSTGLIRYAPRRQDGHLPWMTRLLAHKPKRLASVAMANKTARIVWAVLARGQTYNYPGAKPQRPLAVAAGA